MRTGNCQLWKHYALAIGSPQGRGRESAACSRLATHPSLVVLWHVKLWQNLKLY